MLVLALPVLMSLFIMALVLPMIHAFGTGLSRLLEASKRFSQGEYGFPLKVDTQDELGTLASAFNDMAVQRQRAETALHESEERWQFALVGSRDGVWDWNPATDEIFFSIRRKEMLGYADDELPNSLDEWDKRVHPDDKERCYADLERHLNGETPFYENEHRLKCKDGTYKWILDRGMILSRTEEGKPLRFIGTHTDVTERKQAEEALNRSEANLAEAQRVAHIGSWELKLADNELSWSDEVFRIFEIDARHFAASYEAFLDTVHPDDRDLLNQAYTESVANHTPYDIVHRLLFGDGRIKYVNERCKTFYDEAGAAVRSLGKVQDITERKLAEAAIHRLNQELENRVHERTSELQAVNKELESFAYSVSHDLRTPLRAIDGFSLALAEDYSEQLDETAHDYLQRVRNGAQRMGILIDDLLQLSRVNRGELKMETVDLAEIARAVLEELRAAEPDRQVELTLARNMLVQGDPHLLRTMLDNLLGNSWKFTGRESASHITFDHKTDAPEIYYISDNGVGFDMRHADKLFGAFQRLHRVSDFPGTGVGLATVQRIINRHEGRIWAESQEGKGATFYFSLKSAATTQEIPAAKQRGTQDVTEDLASGRG